MEAVWLCCTSSDGDEVRINISMAILYMSHKKGTRIRLSGDKDNYIDVKETPEGISSGAGFDKHPALNDD